MSLELLRDESSDVRLKLIGTLSELSQVVGVGTLSEVSPKSEA